MGSARPPVRISNTNTYSCLRTVNATHNFLYCEFVSGLITYYDMNVDPYQLRNIYQTLSGHQLNHMHSLLLRLVSGGVWVCSRDIVDAQAEGIRYIMSTLTSTIQI